MSGDKKFELGDYVEVRDRIKLFYELFANGRLVTTHVATELGPDGTPRVLVEAAAYRTPDDPLPGRGWSWMSLPGTTPYTRGSELENTETSAWGRAIASLGILVDRSIASAQEIANKDGQHQNTTPPGPAHNPDGSLIGTAEIGTGSADYELRQGPKGSVLSFRLRSGRQTFKVVAEGVIADALYGFREDVIGQTVTAWGRIGTESWTPPNAKKPIEYQVLALERISTPGFDLPGLIEAPTEPLGLVDESEFDAALAAVPTP